MISSTSNTPRFSKELGTTALLAAPLVLGHLSTGLINFVDNVIAGHHSILTMASVSVGTSLLWLPMMVPVGTLIAVAATVSQLYGAQRQDEIGAFFRQALWVALGLGVILFALLSLIPALMPRLGIDMEIVPGAQAFLLKARWGVPALTLFFCMRYLSEGMHWTVPTMVIGFGGLLVLTPLGYGFTFGMWGLPEMGPGGLGLASAITMWVQALAFAGYLVTTRRFQSLRLFERFDAPDWETIASVLKTGLPIGITILMEGGLFVVTALLIARLGKTPAAAHQIAINVSQLCFMLPMGIAEATTVRVGRAFGAQDPLGIRRAAWAGYIIVLATQSLSATVLLFGHDYIVGVYVNKDDVLVAGLASTLLLFAAAYQFPDGVQVLSAGALRGLRDTRVPMVLAMFSYWIVGMPLGAGLGLGLGWGAQGMWIGLIAALTTSSVLMGLRFRYSSRRLLERSSVNSGTHRESVT